MNLRDTVARCAQGPDGQAVAVAAVLQGGLSRHKAAAQFGVGVSTVINWVRR
jgi:putative transposase